MSQFAESPGVYLFNIAQCIQDLYFETISSPGNKFCRGCISSTQQVSNVQTRVFRHRVVLSPVISRTVYCNSCHRKLTYTCPAEFCRVCTSVALGFIQAHDCAALANFRESVITDPVEIAIQRSRSMARDPAHSV